MSAIRKVIHRLPRVRSTGNQMMPRKTGMTPTYKPIRKKAQKDLLLGSGVSKATGISRLKGMAFDEKSVTAYASP